jgi:hypothetical protein
VIDVQGPLVLHLPVAVPPNPRCTSSNTHAGQSLRGITYILQPAAMLHGAYGKF